MIALYPQKPNRNDEMRWENIENLLKLTYHASTDDAGQL